MRFEWTTASDTGEICFLAQTQGFLPEVISPSLRAKAENIAAEIVNVLDDGEAVYMPILGRSITKRIYDGTDVVTLEEKACVMHLLDQPAGHLLFPHRWE